MGPRPHRSVEATHYGVTDWMSEGRVPGISRFGMRMGTMTPGRSEDLVAHPFGISPIMNGDAALMKPGFKIFSPSTSCGFLLRSPRLMRISPAPSQNGGLLHIRSRPCLTFVPAIERAYSCRRIRGKMRGISIEIRSHDSKLLCRVHRSISRKKAFSGKSIGCARVRAF